MIHLQITVRTFSLLRLFVVYAQYSAAKIQYRDYHGSFQRTIRHQIVQRICSVGFFSTTYMKTKFEVETVKSKYILCNDNNKSRKKNTVVEFQELDSCWWVSSTTFDIPNFVYQFHFRKGALKVIHFVNSFCIVFSL